MTKDEHHERLEHPDDGTGCAPAAVEATGDAADVLVEFVPTEMNGRLVFHASFLAFLVKDHLGHLELRTVLEMDQLAHLDYRYEVYYQA